ncbi:DHH family protein [Listeria weihenstephanensis FSL R9-0317]|uniref:Oligoribonuclease n=1 Tax=Listeria weihenstephanensis TaxID=1006155 RepID=A0A1S7FV45_9LIST|nr:bifunctional oligoribonuclease/PAP phosphatase NrnA [Listeria weihenstephanensis]AQY51321.1 oligoribonuclease [Listeria weihenstephanensis]EUJ36736.1 DHH family protein [Listeria weihenstephanensis FSL R9-0317]
MKRAILDVMKKYETIIIHRHVRPDPDAYGSQMGLAAILKGNFPDKKVYCVGEGEPSLDFLGEVDRIEDSVYDGALVVVCDTANTERIDDARYTLGAELVKIDHHPNEDVYGDYVWVDTEASSCSEMIAAFVEEFPKELAMNEAAARLLYAGIVGDTGRFLFPNTTPKTLRYAADLVAFPFDRTEIFTKMYETPLNAVKLSGYILQNFQMSENGAAHIYINRALLEKFDVTPRDAAQLVNRIDSVIGIKAWILFIEDGDIIRARVRSKKPVINGLAKEYRGGGHPLAAGATLESEAEIPEMVAKLEALCD